MVQIGNGHEPAPGWMHLASPAVKYLIDGLEHEDPARVLWTSERLGRHASLIEIPEMGYVVVHHDRPLTGEQPIHFEDNYIELGRHDAGQFAIALLTALITNSDELIASFLDKAAR
jgi:hypothetical protein